MTEPHSATDIAACAQCDWRGPLASLGVHRAIWHLAQIRPGSYPKGYADGWVAALKASGGFNGR